MAKTKTTATTTETDSSTAALDTTATDRTATRATLKLIDAVREPFTTYLGQYVGLQTTRTKLAPQFMRAFNAWAHDTGGSFVAFVRLFDATVPTKTTEYKSHPTYQSAEYLKRRAKELTARQEAQARGEPLVGATGAGAEAPATPLDALARFVAMVIPLIAREDEPKVWAFFTEDYGWSERRVTALKELVAQSKPFATIRTERGQPRPQLHLVHARTAATKTGTTG